MSHSYKPKETDKIEYNPVTGILTIGPGSWQMPTSGVPVAGTTTTGVTLTDVELKGILRSSDKQSLSGAGAISVTATVTLLTTTGANALTLADGIDGQYKIIKLVVDGGDGTLSVTTKTGFSSIVFNDIGDTITLQFHESLGWIIIANNGCTVT